MMRTMLAGVAMLAIIMAAAVAHGDVRPALANPSAESGELVTLEELCAFRAPLFIDGGDVPAGCAATIEWLRRAAAVDPACAEVWVERGAIPECAARYR